MGEKSRFLCNKTNAPPRLRRGGGLLIRGGSNLDVLFSRGCVWGVFYIFLREMNLLVNLI